MISYNAVIKSHKCKVIISYWYVVKIYNFKLVLKLSTVTACVIAVNHSKNKLHWKNSTLVDINIIKGA